MDDLQQYLNDLDARYAPLSYQGMRTQLAVEEAVHRVENLREDVQLFAAGIESFGEALRQAACKAGGEKGGVPKGS